MKPMTQEEIKELKERCDKSNIAWINTHQVKRLIHTFEVQGLVNLGTQEIIRHSENKDKIIKELISLNLWQARRLKHQQYKDFAYDELEKITDEKYERL